MIIERVLRREHALKRCAIENGLLARRGSRPRESSNLAGGQPAGQQAANAAIKAARSRFNHQNRRQRQRLATLRARWRRGDFPPARPPLVPLGETKVWRALGPTVIVEQTRMTSGDQIIASFTPEILAAENAIAQDVYETKYYTKNKSSAANVLVSVLAARKRIQETACRRSAPSSTCLTPRTAPPPAATAGAPTHHSHEPSSTSSSRSPTLSATSSLNRTSKPWRNARQLRLSTRTQSATAVYKDPVAAQAPYLAKMGLTPAVLQQYHDFSDASASMAATSQQRGYSVEWQEPAQEWGQAIPEALERRPLKSFKVKDFGPPKTKRCLRRWLPMR